MQAISTCKHSLSVPIPVPISATQLCPIPPPQLCLTSLTFLVSKPTVPSEQRIWQPGFSTTPSLPALTLNFCLQWYLLLLNSDPFWLLGHDLAYTLLAHFPRQLEFWLSLLHSLHLLGTVTKASYVLLCPFPFFLSLCIFIFLILFQWNFGRKQKRVFMQHFVLNGRGAYLHFQLSTVVVSIYIPISRNL